MPQDRGNLVERLSAIAARPERLVVGLSSGTSFDGIDAALVRVTGFGSGLSAELVRFGCFPFEPALRARIAAAPVMLVATMIMERHPRTWAKIALYARWACTLTGVDAETREEKARNYWKKQASTLPFGGFTGE